MALAKAPMPSALGSLRLWKAQQINRGVQGGPKNLPTSGPVQKKVLTFSKDQPRTTTCDPRHNRWITTSVDQMYIIAAAIGRGFHNFKPKDSRSKPNT
jgi:hypothetical protein